MRTERHTRRNAMAIGAASAGAVALAGCGSAAEPAKPEPKPEPKPEKLVNLDDVPVGKPVFVDRPGGQMLPGREKEQLIVVRPDEATVNAYSSICTHAECLVKPPKEKAKRDKIVFCFCHNAEFDAMTGEVKKGPPPKPLNKVDVHIADGFVMTGSGEGH